MKQKIHIMIGLLFIAALLFSACSPATQAPPSPTEQQPAQPTQAPAQPTQAPAEPTATASAPTEPATEASATTLTVLIDNEEGPITPANFNTFIGYWMSGWVYDGLYMRTPDLEAIPALATSAESSQDGLNWTIQLREDVNWHDGTPFTSKDVVFSYRFLIEAGRANNLSAVDTIEADGDYAVKITLKQPDPFFISEGLTATYIMPEHIWRDQVPVSGELSQFQGKIGTGPFLLDTIQPGEYYIFKANPDYYRGKPLVEQITAKIVKDRTQQINQLKAGEADAVLSSVPPSFVADLESNADIALSQGSDFFNYIFYTNGSRPPFDRQDVRQAIALSIDTQTLADVIMLGQGVELPLSWYHPDLPWAINIPGEYNPEKAAQLLDDAGLVDSDEDGIREFNGENTDFAVLCDVNNSVEIRGTELIIGWLEDVGIGAHQNCLDIDTEVTFIWPNFVSVPDPNYDMAIWGWSSGPQFQRRFIQYLTGCDFGGLAWANLSGLCDPEMDDLTTELASNPDPQRQEELNRLIQERLADFLFFVPLMSPGGNFAYRPSAYDGWVYMSGTGIMTSWSFLPPEASSASE